MFTCILGWINAKYDMDYEPFMILTIIVDVIFTICVTASLS